MEFDRSSAPEAFKALGDPVRWSIVQYMAEQPELAGSLLDEALPISRPTISYHIRILTQAGLVEVSKRGRNHYYTLRQEVLRGLLDELDALMPGLQLVHSGAALSNSPETEHLPVNEAEVALPAVLPTW